MNLFDRFANAASDFVARAMFFIFCVLLVLIWLPSYFILGSIDTWQLIINTITTIITFLLVALIQNNDQRFEKAMYAKMDAQSQAITELLHAHGLGDHAEGLEDSIGCEKEIGSHG